MSAPEYDEAFMDVMGRQVGETTLKNLDLHLLGEAVLNIVGACVTLGHASPANSLDYIAPPTTQDHVSKHIVRDLLAWVSSRKALAPGCDERLSAWVRDEWVAHQLANSAKALDLDGAA